MAEKKDETNKGHFVDVGRAETEIFVPDPEIAEVIEEEQHGHGARAGGQVLKRRLEEHHNNRIAAGDVDADLEDAAFVGEEAPGGGNSTPDQHIVDEIGGAVGINYEDNEELKPTEKIEQRDRHRWELDPASSEDYKERIHPHDDDEG